MHSKFNNMLNSLNTQSINYQILIYIIQILNNIQLV